MTRPSGSRRLPFSSLAVTPGVTQPKPKPPSPSSAIRHARRHARELPWPPRGPTAEMIADQIRATAHAYSAPGSSARKQARDGRPHPLYAERFSRGVGWGRGGTACQPARTAVAGATSAVSFRARTASPDAPGRPQWASLSACAEAGGRGGAAELCICGDGARLVVDRPRHRVVLAALCTALRAPRLFLCTRQRQTVEPSSDSSFLRCNERG